MRTSTSRLLSIFRNQEKVESTFVLTDLGGNEKVADWISLLAQSLSEFFRQVHGWTSTKYYQPTFILAKDSLNLKIEGLLREFCERVRIPTSASRSGVMEEVFAFNVPESVEKKKYFNDDVWREWWIEYSK